ncbi:MAG TPA: transketolase [Opitutales bacterium]|nr:transketolase [Opitutales bacterium]
MAATENNRELNLELLAKAATAARGLAIDAVNACSSGHLGLPLGTAEIGAVLYGHALRYDPAHPGWINRDRFVLSAGHGSMFLYAWLHMAGYDLSLDEVKNFRKLGSKTPGHPEWSDAPRPDATPGVEATTGPLGQGVGNGVGMALSAKMAEARFNTAEHKIFDHHVVVLAGDGCLQEGVAAEASAFAGHFGLDNLILIYDANDVTLDAMADKTQSEDTDARYRAYGFDVQKVDGHDMKAFLDVYQKAKTATSGKPQLIIAKTEIGRSIPEVAGTSKAHGEGGAKFAEGARRNLGLPEETFYIFDEVKEYFASHRQELEKEYKAWEETYHAWRDANPERAALLDSGLSGEVPSAEELFAKIPEFPEDVKIATRKAGSEVLQPLAQALPMLISGSADLHGSTLNYIEGGEDFSRTTPAGRNIYFGIREHAMGAIMNGIAYDGIFRASGATFMVFSDYLRPSIRLAALSRVAPIYIFTHDSVGVGEDGPTHQPVETVSSLRLIPHLHVIRPGDPEETTGAFVAAVERTEGPTVLSLTRQALPILNEIPVKERREGVLKGGYVARRESGELKGILLASGSELHLAMAAANELGEGIRVVSMPCFERFEKQSAAYREEVLPTNCRVRVAIEAGVTALWHKYVGLDGRVIGVDRFGLSAPGNIVMKELGIETAAVVKAVRELLG